MIFLRWAQSGWWGQGGCCRRGRKPRHRFAPTHTTRSPAASGAPQPSDAAPSLAGTHCGQPVGANSPTAAPLVPRPASTCRDGRGCLAVPRGCLYVEDTRFDGCHRLQAACGWPSAWPPAAGLAARRLCRRRWAAAQAHVHRMGAGVCAAYTLHPAIPGKGRGALPKAKCATGAAMILDARYASCANGAKVRGHRGARPSRCEAATAIIVQIRV